MDGPLKTIECPQTTESQFTDRNEGEYNIRHHDGSSLLWLQDETGAVGITRDVAVAFLPIIQRFAESGSIRETK